PGTFVMGALRIMIDTITTAIKNHESLITNKEISMKRPMMFAAAAMLTSAAAFAQVGPAATLDKATVSQDVAKRTLNKMVINSDMARAIVDACVQWQKQQPG